MIPLLQESDRKIINDFYEVNSSPYSMIRLAEEFGITVYDSDLTIHGRQFQSCPGLIETGRIDCPNPKDNHVCIHVNQVADLGWHKKRLFIAFMLATYLLNRDTLFEEERKVFSTNFLFPGADKQTHQLMYELLMPTQDLPTRIKDATISQLAEEFGVSTHAMDLRLGQINCMC